MVSRQFDFTRKSNGVFSVAKYIEFIEEKRRNHRMQLFIAINGQDCASFGESTLLSCICLIADGALGCIHMARVKRCVDSSRPLDHCQAVAMNQKVHRSRLISTVITPLMDGQN